ncbi:MAG: VCBS repeat-containing protein, partial [Planctomycetota bacterium]
TGPAPPLAGESGASVRLRPDGAIPVSTVTPWSEVDDPNRDGWESEAQHETLSSALKTLGHWLDAETPPALSLIESVASPSFEHDALIPAALETVRAERGWRVERSAGSQPVKERGPAALHRSIMTLRDSLPSGRATRVKFKIISLRKPDQTTSTVETEEFVSLYAQSPERRVEWNARWTTRWDLQAPESPKLLSIRVASFERSTRETATPLFVDHTEAVLGTNASYRNQFLRGYGSWLYELQEHRFFSLLGTPGLAIGDVNGDGLDDVYVCQERGLPNRLFVQQKDGSALDVSNSSGIDFLESSRSALLLDFDGDGNDDLAVALLGAIVLASGDGRGKFLVETVLDTADDTMSLSAVDFDADADLDLYICAYKKDDLASEAGSLSIGAAGGFVYHDANDAAANQLFRNDGSWSFRDVTKDVGLDVNNRRYSFAAAWEDVDDDGDQDLYVANDFGKNNLYRCDKGPDGSVRFVDVSASTRSEDSASGMSVTWG